MTKRVYKYLIAYYVTYWIDGGYKNNTGVLEIDLYDRIKTTIPVNETVKELLTETVKKQQKGEEALPTIEAVQIFNFILLDEFEVEETEEYLQ